MMPIVAYAMVEVCSKEILDCIDYGVQIQDETITNLIQGVADLISENISLGPNATALKITLDSMLHKFKDLPGFDKGAMYGATKLYDIMVSDLEVLTCI